MFDDCINSTQYLRSNCLRKVIYLFWNEKNKTHTTPTYNTAHSISTVFILWVIFLEGSLSLILCLVESFFSEKTLVAQIWQNTFAVIWFNVNMGLFDCIQTVVISNQNISSLCTLMRLKSWRQKVLHFQKSQFFWVRQLQINSCFFSMNILLTNYKG